MVEKLVEVINFILPEEIGIDGLSEVDDMKDLMKDMSDMVEDAKEYVKAFELHLEDFQDSHRP